MLVRFYLVIKYYYLWFKIKSILPQSFIPFTFVFNNWKTFSIWATKSLYKRLSKKQKNNQNKTLLLEFIFKKKKKIKKNRVFLILSYHLLVQLSFYNQYLVVEEELLFDLECYYEKNKQSIKFYLDLFYNTISVFSLYVHLNYYSLIQ